MEKRKHYWNGSWGRLVRRDVVLYQDAGQWIVEERSGGAEGRSRWFEYTDEEAAMARVSRLLALGDGWREI